VQALRVARKGVGLQILPARYTAAIAEELSIGLA
jgi:hypothetical protein